MVIREAEKGDRAYITAAVQKIFAYHREIDPFYSDLSTTDLGDFLDRQDITFVVFSDTNEPLGVVLGQYHAAPVDRSVPYASLRNIWVEETARGSGLAHLLVTAFEAAARIRGAQFVDLHFDIRNKLARALWESEEYELYQERRRKVL